MRRHDDGVVLPHRCRGPAFEGVPCQRADPIHQRQLCGRAQRAAHKVAPPWERRHGAAYRVQLEQWKEGERRCSLRVRG